MSKSGEKPGEPIQFIPAGHGIDLWFEWNFSDTIDFAFSAVTPGFKQIDRCGHRLRQKMALMRC